MWGDGRDLEDRWIRLAIGRHHEEAGASVDGQLDFGCYSLFWQQALLFIVYILLYLLFVEFTESLLFQWIW